MDGMDHLVKLLKLVKSDGLEAAFTEKVHYGGYRGGDVTFQPYQEPLRSLRHSLQDAKLCMSALNEIKARLAKKIRSLQKRCNPLVLEDGIKRIPDEILAHIFEAGHEPSNLPKFALRVSRVSRRFRHVSLQTPYLWTRLSPAQHDDQIAAFLSRSGRLDLQVHLSHWSKIPAEKLRTYLRLISPHSGRWSQLSLTLNRTLLETMDEFGLTYFPRLQSIFCGPLTTSEFPKWNMPLLLQFEGHTMGHPRVVSFPLLFQLTCMNLDFYDYSSFDMSTLAHVLHKMVNLCNLTLEFLQSEDVDVNLETELGGSTSADTPKPHSFHIQSLTIILKDYVRYDFIESLYSILRYLTVSLVDISLLTYGDPDFPLIHRHFPCGSTVRLRTGHPCTLNYVLDGLRENCPNLSSLQLEMSTFKLDLFAGPLWCRSTSFHHLRIHNCVILEEKDVKTLARDLLSHEDFHSLEIISCHKISEEFLMDLQNELGERLTWSL